MNILYDYDPKSFLTNVASFVNQLESVDFLNLFISSLNSDIKAIEGSPQNGELVGSLDGAGSKINLVCDAIRRILEETDHSKYLLSILTTYHRALIHIINLL